MRIVYPTDAPDFADQIASILRHYDSQLLTETK
jgi:hypothetical protein